MINWEQTTNLLNLTPENITNSKRVYVVCERCGFTRLQFYNVAGRRQQHICMSCVKRKSCDYPEIDIEATKQLGTKKIIVGQSVIAICQRCKKPIKIKFQRRKFPNFLCGPCKISVKWEKGEYKPNIGEFTPETRAKIGEQAKARWQNPNYRIKWSMTRASTKEKRSVFSKHLWSDPERLKKLSKSIRECWQSKEYQEKIRILRADPKYRRLMSETITRLWNNPVYRDKVMEIYSSPEFKAKCSEAIKEVWTRPEYRDNLMALYATEDYQRKQAEISRLLWVDKTYRDKMEAIFSAPDFKIKIAKLNITMPSTSFQQKILYSMLDDMKIKYSNDESYNCLIDWYTFDCRVDPQEGILLKRPLLIEVQGIYFHNRKDQIIRDKQKRDWITTRYPEFDLKYIWEHEFSCKDRLASLLKYWLGANSKELIQFDFRDIQCRLIDIREAELFVSKYHYAGKIGRSGLNIGYFCKDIMIAAIIYCFPIRQEVAEKQGLEYRFVYELSRFCIHPSYQVKNLASYLIANSIKFIKKYKPEIKLLVSFADSTYNHQGIIYKASNWKLDGEVAPDYWYADDKGYICHKKTLWTHAKKMCLTESQYCEKYGFIKVLGGKKFRYIYDLSRNNQQI